MSGRIMIRLVDFAAFSFEFACLRSILERSFWCETGAVRDTSVTGQRDVDRANCTVGSNPSLSASQSGAGSLWVATPPKIRQFCRGFSRWRIPGSGQTVLLGRWRMHFSPEPLYQLKRYCP
jgi:hypothetical protein